MRAYRARTQDVVVDELDGGLVVYDTRAHCAHWLEPSAAAVWRACSDSSGESEVASAVGTDVTTCAALLEQLIDIGLVEVVEGVSRRSMLVSVAKVGAAGTLAAPILSVALPAAAAHASATGTGPPQGGTGPGSFSLQSGPGTPGSVDPNNIATIWNGSSWAPSFTPAYNYSSQFGYYTIPGTGWISYYDDPNGDGPTNAETSIDPKYQFYIPTGAQNPVISGEFLIDDTGTLYVNGNLVATTASGYTAPTPFTAPLQTGDNWLSFQIFNTGGGPTGVDYQATVSYS